MGNLSWETNREPPQQDYTPKIKNSDVSEVLRLNTGEKISESAGDVYRHVQSHSSVQL